MDREHLCGSGLGDLSLLELLKLQIRLTTSIGAVEAEKTRPVARRPFFHSAKSAVSAYMAQSSAL